MTGDELKQARQAMRLTQAELAEKVGVQKNTVWRWEDGRNKVPRPVEKLVKTLLTFQ